MQEGHECPKCGDEMEYSPDNENWYCNSCEQFSSLNDVENTNPLPLKNQSTRAIWILVVGILSVVILTFIAAAALYIMVGGIIDSQSTSMSGTLGFKESSTESGLFTGGFTTLSKAIDLEDISLTITDASLGETATQNSLVDAGTVVISNGLRCSFSDVNQNKKLDCEDIFRIEGGGSGDIIKFIHIPTGATFGLYTFL